MRHRREEEGREWKRIQGSGIYGITVLLSHFTLLRYNLRCALRARFLPYGLLFLLLLFACWECCCISL
jgi:hypothetical protein